MILNVVRWCLVLDVSIRDGEGKVKLTIVQKAFIESLKGEGEPDGLWCECYYPKEWRTAKSLEAKGLVEIMDNEEYAKKSGRFEARLVR